MKKAITTILAFSGLISFVFFLVISILLDDTKPFWIAVISGVVSFICFLICEIINSKEKEKKLKQEVKKMSSPRLWIIFILFLASCGSRDSEEYIIRKIDNRLNAYIESCNDGRCNDDHLLQANLYIKKLCLYYPNNEYIICNICKE
jgi:predicted histidine transporter YuiF (NhaC family)